MIDVMVPVHQDGQLYLKRGVMLVELPNRDALVRIDGVTAWHVADDRAVLVLADPLPNSEAA